MKTAKGPRHPAQTLSLTHVHSEKPPHVYLKLELGRTGRTYSVADTGDRTKQIARKIYLKCETPAG